MKIRHQELEIDEGNPFAHCKLERRKYAEILTDIIRLYPDGFVLSINNEWGTGKTTFVKMWQQYLINENFKTVYFNAWENDFDDDPLVAIMAELKTLTNADNDDTYKSVLRKGAVISKNVVPSVLKALVKNYVDLQEVIDAIENATKAATEILQTEIDEYSKKKESIRDFRGNLEKFVKTLQPETQLQLETGKTLVFIIDELDRCRPDYAVKVLEQMKHFFSVAGIVFVLSIDKKHLAASVRGFYGSEQINTDEYLRRFIDLEYSIPEPDSSLFLNYLFEYYELDRFFGSRTRISSEFHEDGSNFVRMAGFIFEKQNVTLRQQEKMFGQTRLVLTLFDHSYYVFPELLLILIFIRTVNPHLYSRIRSRELTLQDISDEYAQLIPGDKYGTKYLLYIEAMLLTFYNNQLKATGLIKRENNEIVGSEVVSKVARGDQPVFLQALEFVNKNWNYGNTDLTYLFKKIELTEPLIFNE